METDKYINWANAILQHAHSHWHEDGWDYIYECFTLDDIIAEIQPTLCYSSALAHIQQLARLHAEIREDIQAEAR